MTTGSLTAIAAILTTAFAALPALAEDPAIGRLNHAGHRMRMHCTAALVAPDRVLTAAHCVRGRKVPDMHFLPGYNRAHYREDLRPARAAAAAPPRDVAALCLARRAATRPLKLGATGPAAGEKLVVAGYVAPRVQAQSRMTCTVAALGADGAFTLSCPVAAGASGAPVLRETEAGAEIVGILSATSANQSLAWDVTGGHTPPGCG